jgi:hypothetical protein
MTSRALTIDGMEMWAQFGAHWRVVHLSSGRAVVEFCACTGEPVERLESHDPAVVEHLRAAHAETAPPQTKETR